MFAWPKKLINFLPNYKYKTDFPSLADEIAKLRPVMNIKATAFTVCEKSINYMLRFYQCFSCSQYSLDRIFSNVFFFTICMLSNFSCFCLSICF